MPELLSFVSVDWIKPLAKRLQRIWEKRNAELAAISSTFGDPRPLASCYIERDLSARDHLLPHAVLPGGRRRPLRPPWAGRDRGLYLPDALAALPAQCLLLACVENIIGEGQDLLADGVAGDEIAELTARHPAMVHLDQLDVGGRSLLNRNAEGEYRFSHYSIQEFLPRAGWGSRSAIGSAMGLPAR
jgi:hypothetical protein